MDDERLHDYVIENEKASRLLRSFVDHTLRDRKQKILNSKLANADAPGHTLGEMADRLKLDPLTEQEQAAVMVETLLDPAAFLSGRSTATTMIQPCAIYELQSETDTTGTMIIEGEPLSSILKKQPELKDRVIVSTNDFFGTQVYRVKKRG